MNARELLLQPWVYGPLASLGLVLALFFIKGRLIRVIGRVASRTTNRMDDVLFAAAAGPVNLLIVASGLLLLGRLLPLPEESDRAVDLGYTGCVVVGIVWFMDRLARALLEFYSTRVPILGQGRPMIQGLLRGLFIGIGVLILLDSSGISIAPLLASLGVGSLAVALALQGTLANLFAGMHLLADRVVEPGHWVRIDSGQEGEVVKIGWRSTRIRLPSNVTVIVPNAKLVDSVVTNFDVPDPSVGLTVPLAVHYDSDLTQVERIAMEIVGSFMKEHPEILSIPEPSLRVTAFGASGIELALGVTVRRANEQPLVRDLLLRRLHARFREEGIVIPYPTRTIDLPAPLRERAATFGPRPGEPPAGG